MKIIYITDILNSTNAATRADARDVLAHLSEDTQLDFSKVKYISSAFVDELVNHLSPDTITEIENTAPDHIQKMFSAVLSRKAVA